MADTITDALKSIRTRKRKLEAELKLLMKAEESLCRIVNAGGDSSLKDKAVGVSAAVRAALHDLGEAESSAVIEHIRKKYLPDANENTIRSLLSVWAVKGRVVKSGNKYLLSKAAQNVSVGNPMT